jgi:hypothetical protein
MRSSRAVVVWLLVIALFAGTFRPSRAEALSDGELAAVIVGSIAGYIAIVVIGASLAYRKKSGKKSELVAPPAAEVAARGTIRFGPGCPAQGGMTPLFCW